MKDLKIIVPENAREFGEKVQRHLNELRNDMVQIISNINKKCNIFLTFFLHL